MVLKNSGIKLYCKEKLSHLKAQIWGRFHLLQGGLCQNLGSLKIRTPGFAVDYYSENFWRRDNRRQCFNLFLKLLSLHMTNPAIPTHAQYLPTPQFLVGEYPWKGAHSISAHCRVLNTTLASLANGKATGVIKRKRMSLVHLLGDRSQQTQFL